MLRMEGKEGAGQVVANGGCGGGAGRAEIDMSAPFQSVKEAVMLFGERVLGGEVYAGKLSQIQAKISKNETGVSRLASITAELEETKQSLEKAKEESQTLANCLNILKEELEKTKRELQHLKHRETEKRVIDDVKLVKKVTEVEVETATSNAAKLEFQRKRCVTFANPPSLARVLVPEEAMLERQSSVVTRSPSTQRKKKPLIPLIGGLFSKKKGHQESSSPKAGFR